MQRYFNPHNAPLFRGGERMRLMAALGSLLVLGMLMTRARNPRNWEWCAQAEDLVTPRILEARDRALGRTLPPPLSDEELARMFELHRPPRRARRPGPSVSTLFQGEPSLMALADMGEPPAPASATASDAAKPDQSAKPTDAAKPEAAAGQQPGVHNAANPQAAHLADDVPPPIAAPVDVAKPTEGAAPAGVSAPERATTPADGAMPADGAKSNDDAKLADGAKPSSPAAEAAQPRVYNAANPQAGRLADDVPPPPAEPDAALAQSVAAPQGSAEYGPSVESRELEANMAATPPDRTPVDQDPIELKDFHEEAQAITDRMELRPEEMAAYWRLIDWERQQTFKAMDARARNDLMYAHLFKQPDHYRGELIRLKLHITRTLATDANVFGQARNLARTYEAWGCTDESTPNPYVVMLTNLPADFPLRHDMLEDVTFVGYFFKLMAIKSRDDKHRAVPLLIGKVFWHENPPVGIPDYLKWALGGGLFGLIALVAVLVRFTFELQPLKPRSTLPPLADGEDSMPIEDWLGNIEDRAPDGARRNGPAKNGHIEHETNGHTPHSEYAEDEPPP